MLINVILSYDRRIVIFEEVLKIYGVGGRVYSIIDLQHYKQLFFFISHNVINHKERCLSNMIYS